ncbi:MAG TPA: hypothetical protein VJ777_09650 [Mycobacterium sp.]|nr:hypothetical protein [Mycobacterium sp.]
MKSKYEVALAKAKKSKRRTKEVYDLLMTAHEKGDARATYALATWYLHGTQFTKKSIAKATQMLKHAESENVPDAAYDLAVSFEKGAGVRKSAKQAFALYVKAALLGERQSVYEVGRMYYYGIGTGRDRRLAEIWLDRAEALGVGD